MKMIFKVLLIGLCLFSPFNLFAPPAPPTTPTSGGSPIDGGITLLVLAGTAIGIKFNQRNTKES